MDSGPNGARKRCADQNNSGRFVPLQEQREMADRLRDQPSPLHALGSGLLDHPLDVINGVVEGQGCASCEAFGLVAINMLRQRRGSNWPHWPVCHLRCLIPLCHAFDATNPQSRHCWTGCRRPCVHCMNKTVRCKIGAALVGIRGRGPDLSVPTPEDGRPRSGPTFLQQIMADSGPRIAI